MIFASKTTFNHYNLKILRPKVTNTFTNFCKKFCKSPPRILSGFFKQLQTKGKQILPQTAKFNKG